MIKFNFVWRGDNMLGVIEKCFAYLFIEIVHKF